MPHAPVIAILVRDHFDVLWRRRFRTAHDEDDRRFACYAEMEAWYIDDALALAARDPGFVFEVECALVVAEYLRRQPHRLAELRALAAAGRFAVAGGGWNIVDGNLVTAETIIRNFTNGLDWLDENLGLRPNHAIRNDAFGNPAQLPQILRGLGFDCVAGLSYSQPAGDYWRGLDGSTVYAMRPPQRAGWTLGGYYAPHDACAGRGCAMCAGRGIMPNTVPAYDTAVDPDPALGWGMVAVSSEEGLPTTAILTAAATLGRRHATTFTTSDALCERFVSERSRVDHPPEDRLHPGVELNPNNTGCYTTRIATKQRLRSLERRLLAWETLLAVQGRRPASLARAWEAVLLGAFHDCVTGTMIDAAYAELMEELAAGAAAVDAASAEVVTTVDADAAWAFQPTATAIPAEVWLPDRAGIAAVVDTDGRRLPVERRTDGPAGPGLRFTSPALPAAQAATYRLITGDIPAEQRIPDTDGRWRFANAHLTVRGDAIGLLAVDRADGVPVAVQRRWRPGQLVLESDYGSPWATLSTDRRRAALDRLVEPLGVWRGPGWNEARYRVHTHWNTAGRSRGMAAEIRYRLDDALPWLSVRVDILWEAWDARLRLVWPLAHRGRHLHGVPAGHLDRAPYVPTAPGAWDGTCGDHAAIEWSAVEHADGWTGFLDRGHPGRSLEPEAAGDDLWHSLLRSPTQPTYLYKPDIGGPHGLDGMRDEGRHTLHCAIAAGIGGVADSPLADWARGWNTVLPAGYGSLGAMESPSLIGDGGIELAAVYRDAAGRLVVRLVERRGHHALAELVVPASCTAAQQADLRGQRPAQVALADQRCRLPLRPWQIATLVLA